MVDDDGRDGLPGDPTSSVVRVVDAALAVGSFFERHPSTPRRMPTGVSRSHNWLR